MKKRDWNNALRGKTVVLDFWEGWCKPCKEMWPHLESAARQVGVDIIKVRAGGVPLHHPMRKLVPGWKHEWDKDLPYLILLKNGIKIAEIGGGQTPEKLKSFLSKG